MSRSPTPDLATACPVRSDGQEDRGTSLWVWTSSGGWRVRFESFPGAFECLEVSAPIGWWLAADPTHGVVLRSTCGLAYDAASVLTAAERGECGFGVRGREAV